MNTDIHVGLLVRSKGKGRLGIVVEDAEHFAGVFWGDGLDMVGVSKEDLEPVPFYPGANIPADFTELIKLVP